MFYSLNKKVQLRKESKGGVIYLKDKMDVVFFYIPNDFDIFLKMKNNNICIKINIDNFEEKFIEDLSFLIKNKFLVFEKNPKGKFIIIKNIPKLIKLFITPTIHFRRYYSYGK